MCVSGVTVTYSGLCCVHNSARGDRVWELSGRREEGGGAGGK